MAIWRHYWCKMLYSYHLVSHGFQRKRCEILQHFRTALTISNITTWRTWGDWFVRCLHELAVICYIHMSVATTFSRCFFFCSSLPFSFSCCASCFGMCAAVRVVLGGDGIPQSASKCSLNKRRRSSFYGVHNIIFSGTRAWSNVLKEGTL